jgi:MoxR-like ATPase
MNNKMKLLSDSTDHVAWQNNDGSPVVHAMTPVQEGGPNPVAAINAALAINRPLLVLGEPGIGKTQLALAAATALGRAYIPFVVDSRTEARDLLWRFDAVARLAAAQVGKRGDGQKLASSEHLMVPADPMAEQNFVVPGPLWWAFDWEGAQKAADSTGAAPPSERAELARTNGSVVLIDEIDKADSDVPNGLLEALGAGRFRPQGWSDAITCKGVPPLIIITSNQERPLPDAFIRRCLVLHLEFPDTREAQIEFLLARAQHNAGGFEGMDEEIFREVARWLAEDRRHAQNNRFYPLPGQAEFFDLLRGASRLSHETRKPVRDIIEDLRAYTLQKHPSRHSRG